MAVWSVEARLVKRARHSLPVTRLHDTDTAAGNIPEANVEATELVADDEEHAERLLRVLYFGQEVRSESEGERDLCRLVEVCL